MPLYTKVVKGEAPCIETRLYMSDKVEHGSLRAMLNQGKPAYPNDEDVHLLQELTIRHPPKTQVPSTGWRSHLLSKSRKVEFFVVAELKGAHLIFKLKYQNLESRPSERILGDWRDYEKPYVPPSAA